jgi:predicted transposase YbfD/YdcC
MTTSPSAPLLDHFASLDDPRVERTKLHPLLSIIAIATCAVISGAEGWDDIEAFGEAKEEWLSTFLDLPHGIPSHDTFNRVFAALDPLQFQHCFQSWMEAVRTILPAEVIALDGKTVRGSRAESKRAIHMVSAWASTNRLVLAQVKVDDNTQRVPDEITALPAILQQLTVAGCLVTIDAMGCQRTIAHQILDQGGDYVLGLKGNQGTLEQDVQLSVTTAEADGFAGIRHDQAETIDKGHGRIETRRALVIDDPAVLTWLQDRHAWPGLEAIGMIHAERRIGDKRTAEDRFYLLSHPLSAAAFGDAVRSHWGIENSVHWVLDLSFHEDQSRIRAGYAAENFAVLRHIALNLLRHQQTKRLSVKGKRKQAGWDNAFLLRVLQGL